MFHHVSRLSIFLAVVATSQPVLASAPDSMVLEPSSQWQLDYGDTRCRIGRIFGEGETETALYLEQVEPSESLHWIVGGGIVTRLGSKFTTQFGPGFDPYITRSDIGLTISGFGDAVRGTGFEDSESNAESDEEEPIGLPHLDPNEGASVEWVRLSRGNRSYQLKLGNLKPVYEAMNTCMVSQLGHLLGRRSRIASQAKKCTHPDKLEPCCDANPAPLSLAGTFERRTGRFANSRDGRSRRHGKQMPYYKPDAGRLVRYRGVPCHA